MSSAGRLREEGVVEGTFRRVSCWFASEDTASLVLMLRLEQGVLDRSCLLEPADLRDCHYVPWASGFRAHPAAV